MVASNGDGRGTIKAHLIHIVRLGYNSIHDRLKAAKVSQHLIPTLNILNFLKAVLGGNQSPRLKTSVLRGMSLAAFQGFGHVNDSRHIRLLAVPPAQLGVHFESTGECDFRCVGHQLCQVVCPSGRISHNPGHVLNYHLGSHRAKCHDAANGFGSILLGDVVDDLLPADMLDVSINPCYPVFRHIYIGSRLYLVLPNARWLI